ncbi:leucine-rich repeat-containing protein 63 [Ochotona curzoniae]|uniref:leucine-rich repeat-containing protein 63 n=1 Tax=Ochotona curzoniae TaxID=130825 RepID=UPI001B34FCDB|nr:leucine-rich repeat-containing protein 63 [Ochotona curzoniae]
MQENPQLLRRPLPPKLSRVSLYQKKFHTAKTGKIRSRHVAFSEDETISTEANYTVPDSVLERDLQAPAPIKVQNIYIDHHIQERVTTLSTAPKDTKMVSWHIPDTATGSIFFPSCQSASTRVFRKEAMRMRSLRKHKEEVQSKPHQIKIIYINDKLEEVSTYPELSKVFNARWPVFTTTFDKVYPDYHTSPTTPSHTYEPSLRDLSATYISPLPSTVSVRPESLWSERYQHSLTHLSRVVVSITQYPGNNIPPPALPRKPRTQSIIETIASENEKVESAPPVPRQPEGKFFVKMQEEKQGQTFTLHGEGFKTVAATRYETLAAMTDLAILHCQLYGRNALNLKGFFLLSCPDLTCLAFQLIYLNLSFNDLYHFPTEVFCLKNLQVLKLRNNPIKEIPSEIKQLKFLRIFCISFNLITNLPLGLFALFHLEELDISYNEFTFIPNEIYRLRSLEKLHLDGNYLTSLPPGILKLNLTKIYLENTFTHPYFWAENSLNTPQRLTQITAWFIIVNNIHKLYEKIPVKAKLLLKCTRRCDWCHGPMFGNGLCIIRSCDMFGASQLPIMFHVCCSFCYRRLKESTYYIESISGKRVDLNVEPSKES